jgi:hypothetical protein
MHQEEATAQDCEDIKSTITVKCGATAVRVAPHLTVIMQAEPLPMDVPVPAPAWIVAGGA